MSEKKHHHEEDVARLLAEHWEEVEMDSAYRLSVLDQTRRAVASNNKTNSRIWQALIAVTALRHPVSDEQGRKLQAGDRLAAGSVLRTGKGGRVSLVTHRGAELTMDENSELALTSTGIASILRGRLYCSNHNKEITRIDTPAGQVQLIGTVVNTAVIDDERVAVTVVEGKVRLKNEQGKATVDSGKQSILTASLPPEPGRPVNTLAETAWYDGRGDIVSDFGDIAYLVQREDGLVTEVWAMNSDGSNRRRLKSYSGHSIAPGSWLAGEQWLQVESWSMLWTRPDISSRSAHSSEGHPILDRRWWLLNAAAGQDMPFPLPEGYLPLLTAVSPNSRRIAFCGWYQSDSHTRDTTEGGVWVYDMETGKITKVLDGWLKTPVAWAPDNKHLATSAKEGYVLRHSLVVVDTDSGEITELGINGVGPVFSPDGKKLAYTGGFETDGPGGSWHYGVPTNGSIWVKDWTSDAEPIQVSPDREGGVEPHWSPDGTRIVYSNIYWKSRNASEDNYHDRHHFSPIARYKGDVDFFFNLYTANADGSGSKEIYNGKGHLNAASWTSSGDAVYATTPDAVFLIAADGSGLIKTIPTDDKSSILPADQQIQTDAAISELQEAVFQFAMGKVLYFEGNLTRAREAYRKSEELFAGLVWKYPLSGLSTTDTIAYADKAKMMVSTMASKSEEEMFSEICGERMWYAGMIASYAIDKESGLPADLESVENWALTSENWNANWIYSGDTEHIKMIFRCPETASGEPVPFIYHAPTEGTAPKIGDVLISCPNHPEHRVVWDEGMQGRWDRLMKK